MTQPVFIYHHHWDAGDVLIWGSRCALNNTLPYGSVRVTLNRVAIS